MSFASLEFAGFCCLAILLMNIVRGQNWRSAVILALNIIFISSFIPSLSQSIPLLAFILLGYGAVLAALRVGAGGFSMLVVLVVGVFVWLKRYAFVGFLPALPFAYATIGLSYILFRILHLLVDVHERALAPPSFSRFLAYLFFFPTLVSGPVQRYEGFERQLETVPPPRTSTEIDYACRRIVFGLFLTAGVTQFTSYLFSHMETRIILGLSAPHMGLAVPMIFAASAFVFLCHLYLNFSGYMEMVIGLGLLCGFELPENFDKPYMAENFLDLWSRWHITLSNWFKFYVFNPCLKSMAARFGTPARMPYLSVLAFFFTFGVMGIWHGSSIIFLIYGLFLGLGASLNKLYQIEMGRRLGRKGYRDLAQKGWHKLFARAFTLGYFAVAVVALWLPDELAPRFLSFSGLALAIFSLVAITVSVAILELIIRALWPLWRKIASMTRTDRARPDWFFPVMTGIRFSLVILLVAMIDAGGAPEFVYKVF